MNCFVSLVLVGCLAFSGCAKNAAEYSVHFASKGGDVLASGSLTLKEPLPSQGKVRARYHLQLRPVARTQKEIDWFFRLFEQKKEGDVEWTVTPARTDEAPHNLNFMPGKADSNIFASCGPIIDGKAKGTWVYSIFAGGWEGGTFELSKR